MIYLLSSLGVQYHTITSLNSTRNHIRSERPANVPNNTGREPSMRERDLSRQLEAAKKDLEEEKQRHLSKELELQNMIIGIEGELVEYRVELEAVERELRRENEELEGVRRRLEAELESVKRKLHAKETELNRLRYPKKQSVTRNVSKSLGSEPDDRRVEREGWRGVMKARHVTPNKIHISNDPLLL